MKKLYTLLSALALAAVATAQAPVLAQNYMYQTNMGLRVITTNGSLQLPNSGQNQTWDYSSLSTNGIDVNFDISTIAQLPAPFNTNAPAGSNQAVYGSFNGETQVIYLKLKPDTAAIVSAASTTQSVNYGVGQLEAVFPMSYNDVANSDMIINLQGQIVPATTDIKYAGYGTLKLPSGTYNNVILIETEITFQGGVSTISYSFYKPGYTYLLKISEAQTGYNVNYTTTAPLSISENAAAVGLNVYPNPAADNLVFVTAKPTNYTLQVYNVNGALVSNTAVETNSGEAYPLDVTTLPQGIYTMVVTDANGNVATKRFVK